MNSIFISMLMICNCTTISSQLEMKNWRDCVNENMCYNANGNTCYDNETKRSTADGIVNNKWMPPPISLYFFRLRNTAKISDYLSIADTETLVRALITSKLHSPPLRLTMILVG